MYQFSQLDVLRRCRLDLAAGVIWICFLALCSTACSGAENQPDDQPVEDSVEQQESAFDPGALFEAHADWMPADTLAVAVGDPSALWQFVHDMFPPADRGGDEHYEAMRRDISQLVASRLGFDPSATEAVVIGGGQQWQVMILQGQFDGDFRASESYEAEGYTAYRLNLPLQSSRPNPLQNLWIVPLEEPAGVAVFLDKQSFAAAAAARAAGAQGLAGTAKLEAYNQLLETTGGSSAVVASHLDEGYQRLLSSQLPFPAPEALVVSLGDDLQAEISGSKKALDGLQVLVEKQYGQANSILDGKYEQRQHMGTGAAAGIIIGHHLSQAYADALRVERSEGVLRVNTALPRGPGGTMIGMVASVAAPAFIKYIKRSKASEAHGVLGRLESSALAYYAESGDGGSCEFPPSANPVPAGRPCCDGVGPREGAKWTPPPSTWDQEGWKVLDVQLNEPSYFAYQVINKSSDAGGDKLVLRAFADFERGGDRHTVEVNLEGRQTDDGSCEASSSPSIVYNEFD